MTREWKIWLLLGFLLEISFFVNVFFWDFFSGADTEGFGVTDPYVGMPMFYVYMVSFFSAFITMTGIRQSERFGMGFYLWVPYAVVGLFVETYFELILDPVLRGFWAAALYSVFGLLTGLSADLSHGALKKRWRDAPALCSGIAAIAMNLFYFLSIVVALGLFYRAGNVMGSFSDPGSFLGVAYFGLPWLMIQSFAGGYLACAVPTLWPRQSRGKGVGAGAREASSGERLE